MAVYHEKQRGLLCGQHALNALLQGPVFSDNELTAIAHQLDARERELLGDIGVSKSFGNLDAAGGNFSIQVLTCALEEHGFTIRPASHPDLRRVMEDPATRATGVIVNADEHWFTMRAVDSLWWNFNSTLPQPARIPAEQVKNCLQALERRGRSVFVVTSRLPQPEAKPIGKNWLEIDPLEESGLRRRNSGESLCSASTVASATERPAENTSLRYQLGRLSKRASIKLRASATVVKLRRARSSWSSTLSDAPQRGSL